MTNSPLSEQEIAKYVKKSQNSFSKGFKVACPQLQVFDIRTSLNFYCNVLGMTVLKHLDFPPAQMSDYFLGYEDPDESYTPPKGTIVHTIWAMTKPRTLNLRHNWSRQTPYEIGDGLGNISIIVPDVYATAKRLEELKIPFLKKVDEGGLTGLAVVKDPDGYPIEFYSVQTIRDHCS